MLTITNVLLLGAFVSAIVSAMGRCPIWIPVILLCVVEALQIWPR